ncbi:AMP-binding protein [Parvibaculum sp.]|uniref:AMP-binding protein n=1 Tax=Parvibaculum sp. TaxID=2024848 RepID=UPI001B088D66|nr:AMP-binding protein [Parvibaculum sp.]MBO6635489.1 AMP-binding protein [Parvibaculum sp.]MBO6677039.1 AMP-binding protein [Parvibaculum sp.]MBO6685984.1 AMP-binding protein [Parvibaculum sp.]MBO6906562.1 AMP-binding protein [Parvibaculum sp.]
MPALRSPLIHPFSNFDVPHLLAVHAAARPDHPFLIWEPFEGTPKTWSYARFEHEAKQVAAGLKKRGAKVGDRVLIHLDNCPESLIAWYACAHLGAVAVTTNARSVEDDLIYFSEHAGVVGAITQPRFAALVAASCRNIKWLAVTETDNGAEPEEKNRPPKSESFAALYGDVVDVPMRTPDPMLPVGIQYTSGTTSRPKGVVWTHANALWGAKLCAMHEDLRGSDVHLTYLPLFHTNAQSYSVLAALWVGATVVLQPRFSASRFWSVSERHGCTWTSMVPFCVRALMGQEKPKSHSYRYWGNGISAPPTDEYFGVKTIGWWGMTETITHGIVGDIHLPNRPLSIGKPATSYEIAILRDDNTPVDPGETGNLLVRGVPGLSLFLEYLNNPEATAKTYDDQGYFITGDRVTLGEDGFISFADRDKDMLKVGGENVAASEIERVVMTVPGIQECAVVAKRDPMLDEVPVAFVLVPGGEAAAPKDLAAQIDAACAKGLADFKRPRDIRIVDALPRSTLEKIAKAELRKIVDGE